MVFPAFLLLMAITIYPLVRTVILAFSRLELSVSPNEKIVGLDNFVKVFTGDPRFWNAMKNTAILTLGGITIQLVFGLLLALLAVEMGKSRSFWVTLFLIPIMIAPVVSGFQFRVIFNDTFGPLNYFIKQISGGRITPPAWTANPSTSLFTIMMTDVWQWTPFMMLLILAGLESISPELIEAARVDGASYLQILWGVKLPMLLPIIIIGLLIRMMDMFKTFDLVVLLTEGGPGSSSETVAYYTYINGFKFFSMGYTAAIAFVQLVVIIFVSRVFLSIQKRQRGSES
jgi:multiple sugar transport system permease protein